MQTSGAARFDEASGQTTFDFSLSVAFVGGSALVIAATILYSSPGPEGPQPKKGAAMFEEAAARPR